MNNIPEKVQYILVQARKLAATRPTTWADYEYFKRQLLSAGFYGYERQLTDALDL